MTVALSIQNLEKEYDNGVRALKGISLEVETGDFFALLKKWCGQIHSNWHHILPSE